MAGDQHRVTTPTSPARNAEAVTPSDSVNLDQVAKALYVGTTGNITLVTPEGDTVLFSNVPVGFFPVQTARVNSTATTASNIVALYS